MQQPAASNPFAGQAGAQSMSGGVKLNDQPAQANGEKKLDPNNFDSLMNLANF